VLSDYEGGKVKEEEEKKKIGVGGSISSSAPKNSFISTAPSKGVGGSASVSQKQAQASSKPSQIADLPRDYFEREASRASNALQSNGPKSALADYFKMKQAYGSDKAAADRIKRTSFLWNTYMPGTDGKKAIWALANSTYSTEAIESMLSQGHKDIYGFAKDKATVVPRQSVVRLGLNPDDQNDVFRAGLAYRLFGYSDVGPVRNTNYRDRIFGDTWGKAITSGAASDSYYNRLTNDVLTNDRFYGDRDDSLKYIKNLEGTKVENSPVFGKLSPKVQEKIKWYWYEYEKLPKEEQEKYREPLFSEDLSDQDYTALESAMAVGKARWLVKNVTEEEYAQKEKESAIEGMTATFALGGVSAPMAVPKLLTTAVGKAAYLLGFAGAIAPQAIAQEAAEDRAKVETAVAAAMEDPLRLTSGLAKKKLGGEAGPETTVRVTYADKALAMTSYVYSMNPGQENEDPNGVKQIQRNLQYPVYSADGKMICPGFGHDLKITGVWDGDWTQALSDYYEWEASANVADMTMLMNTNALSHSHPLDGNMNDPEVIDAIGRLQQQYIEAENDTANPTFLKQVARAAGVPLTKNQLGFWWRGLTSEGTIQGLFRLPIKAAEAAGGAMADGMLGALNYGARSKADPVLKKIDAEMLAYAVDKGVANAAIIKNSPWMLDQLYQDGDLKDDPKAQEIYKGKTQQVARLVKDQWHADIRGTACMALGMDPAKVTKMAEDDPMGVHMYNLLFMGALTVGGAKLNIFTSGKSIVPRPGALAGEGGSQEAYLMLRNVEKEVVADNAAGAADLILGQDGRALANEFTNTYKGVAAESSALRDLGSRVRAGLQNGNEQIVEQVTGLDSEAAAQLTRDIKAAVPEVAPGWTNVSSSPAEAPYTYAPVKVAGVGKAKWYHGTARETAPDSVTFGRQAENLVGPGLYLTDSPPIATGYAKSRTGGQSGTVFSTDVKLSPTKIVDLDRPASAKAKKIVTEFLDSQEELIFTDASRDKLKNSSLLDTYQSIRKALADEGFPMSEADEIIGNLNYKFVDAGFQAFKHKGGQFVGKKPHNVLVLLDPFGELGSSGGLTNFSKHEPIVSVTASATKTVAEQEAAVAEILGRRQASNHDIIDISTYIDKTADDLYAGVSRLETDRTGNTRIIPNASQEGRGAASVFPYYRAKGMNVPSYTKVRMERLATDLDDPMLKWMFKKSWKAFERAPTDKILINDQKSQSRIFTDALAASRGDAKFAKSMRDQWMNARTVADYEAVGAKIVEMGNAKFKLSVEGMGNGGGRSALNVNPETGALEYEGTLMSTAQERYVVNMPGLRNTMKAPYNVGKMETVGDVVDGVLYNSGRWGRRTVSRIMDPARNLTVGYGPGLFPKHAVVDMGIRLPMEAGAGALLRSRKYSKRWNEMQGEVNPTLAKEGQMREHRMKVSEQQWNVDEEATPRAAYESRHIYEPDKNGDLQPVNLKYGIHDLRRWASDEDFVHYSKGGEAELRKWLYTPNGRSWMETGGHVKFALDNVADAATMTPEVLFDTAVDNFVGRAVGQFRSMESVAPNIYDGLASIAKGEMALNDKNLKSIVLEANKNGVVENPALSIDVAGPKGLLGTISPRNTVKYLMLPNKAAREMFFKATAVDVYEPLVKAGIDSESAYRIALDTAELKTTRAMFDLAEATYAEAQNRWFAMFATKHRLYATWLGKAAIERPWIAGAASEFTKWMEDRNADDSIPEWDKGKIVIDAPFLPGGRQVINPATMLWLADYPTETTVGKGVEAALFGAAGLVPGVPDVNINWGDFGPSLMRFDTVAKTLLVTAPLLIKWSQGELTNDYITKYMDELPGKFLGSNAQQQRLQKAINKQMMYMEMNGQTPTDSVEATQRAIFASIKHELWTSLRPFPMTIYSEDDLKYKDAEKKYFGMTQEEQVKFINNPANEWFGWGLGASSTNPGKRSNIEKGWKALQANRKAWTAALDRAMDDGSILNPDIFNSIMDHYEGVEKSFVDKSYNDEEGGVDNYNADFAEVYTKGGFSDFKVADATGILLPFVDPNLLMEQGDIPDETKSKEYKRELNAAFEDYCKSNKMIPTDMNDPAVFWLKQSMVENPYADFVKTDPTEYMSKRQQTAADILAQGEPGPQASTKYAAMVHNHLATKMLGRGIQWNAKSGVSASEPVFALMTSDEKKMIGWNTTPSAETNWRLWAYRKQAADQYLRDAGVTSSNEKIAVRVRAALKSYGDELATKDEAFKKEWEFSQMPLEARLLELGVGGGDDDASKGWYQFLGLVSDYRQALSEVQNGKKLGVGPTAKAAREVAQTYLQRLVDLRLKEKYPSWWTEFDGLFPLTSFGFNPAFRLENNADSDYWWATKDTDLPTEEELTGFTEGV
jgi:hypothetical protein